MFLFAGTYATINRIELFKQLMFTFLLSILKGMALREILERPMNIQKIFPVILAISATVAILLLFMAINPNILPIMKN